MLELVEGNLLGEGLQQCNLTQTGILYLRLEFCTNQRPLKADGRRALIVCSILQQICHGQARTRPAAVRLAVMPPMGTGPPPRAEAGRPPRPTA